jgi:hypothetical protein
MACAVTCAQAIFFQKFSADIAKAGVKPAFD